MALATPRELKYWMNENCVLKVSSEWQLNPRKRRIGKGMRGAREAWPFRDAAPPKSLVFEMKCKDRQPADVHHLVTTDQVHAPRYHPTTTSFARQSTRLLPIQHDLSPSTSTLVKVCERIQYPETITLFKSAFGTRSSALAYKREEKRRNLLISMSL